MNPNRGMVAVETEGGYTIIELLGDEVEIGDELRWNNQTGLGSETYFNQTQNKPLDVYVQNHWVAKQDLRQQLLMDH